MKIKEGTWAENIKMGFLTFLSTLPLGYLLLLLIDDWLFSVVKVFYLVP